jgi:hypothetical protein
LNREDREPKYEIDWTHHPGDRWGRYAVVLLAEKLLFLRDDPESGACIASAASKWQRYDKAEFVCDSKALIGTLSLEIPLARSAEAAVGEARDALYKFFIVCVRDPGDYEIKPLSVTFLGEQAVAESAINQDRIVSEICRHPKILDEQPREARRS